MKYYIIKKDNELKIIKVPLDQEALFLESQPGTILCSGDSLAEAFRNFEKLDTERGQ